MKYLKDIHEHLTNRSEVSKKLKKFFGVFVVALLLMSMTSNTIVLEKKPDCFELADIYANDVACEVEEITGAETTHSEWHATWLIFYDACNN